MTNEAPSVLEIARAALEQEFRRIQYLVSPKQGKPLGDYTKTVNQSFRPFLTEANKLLNGIGQAAENNDTALAWERYAQFRSNVMPIFATELLAVIGGLYLMEKGLDNPLNAYWEDPAGSAGAGLAQMPDIASFSKMAENLVNHNLTYRTNRPWSSVLIVGEERVAYPEAEIIRLRFPACDIWNLPFTAAEYGYLLARNKELPEGQHEGNVESFFDSYYQQEVELLPVQHLRQMLRAEVDPRGHDEDGAQRPPLSFLPEIVAEKDGLWDRYLLQGELMPATIASLAERQDELFCRLFGDAFATAFIGPAYVQALLHLRFLPDASLEQFTGDAPPFALRFVFALETLRWLDHHADALGPAPGFFRESPFRDEVDPSTGIRRRWLEALAAAGKDADPRQPEYGNKLYDALVSSHRELLRRVHAALESLHSENLEAYHDTFESWRAARDYLTAGITASNLQLSRDDHFQKPWERQAVLNAAWAARVSCDPDAVGTLERNALRLLDPTQHDKWFRPELAREERMESPGARTRPGDRRTTEAKVSTKDAAATVVMALAGRSDLLERFNAMRLRRSFTQDADIALELSADPGAVKMYKLLVDGATQ